MACCALSAAIRTLGAGFLLLLAGATGAATITAGSIPGQFAVADSGAATYQVALAVPPGIAGMQPRLAFAFNSQGGNGLLGQGWSLEGLGVVHRCPRTLAQDGVRGSVNFDGNDRFCLDGQRLVRVAGTEGAAGSEYRTERDSFSRIVAVGTAGTGPASFTVQTKAGLTLQFGSTAAARLEAQGSATVRAWALDRIVDVAGNAMTVTYQKDAANGAVVPARIDYGGHSVRFAYEGRHDVPVTWQAGSRTSLPQRLAEAATYVGEARHTSYRLAYAPAAGPEAPSQLARIVLSHAASDTELAPTEVAWSGVAVPGFGGGIWPGHGGGNGNNIVADFDGDGRSDLAGYAGSGKWHVVLSTGSAFAGPLWDGPPSDIAQTITGDFNGDGLTDLGTYIAGTGLWNVCLSTGSNFSCRSWQGHAGGHVDNLVADFDGDGRSDIARHLGGGLWEVCLSLGSTFQCGRWTGGTNIEGSKNVIGDFNGDGRADLATYADNGAWHVALSTGTGFGGGMWQAHGGALANNVTGDFNGDGLTDLAGYTGVGASWHVCFSTGLRFQCEYLDAHTAGVAGNVAADFNGDGRTDLAGYTGSGGQWHVCLSKGVGFECRYWGGGPNVVAGTSLGDFDGDGQQDMVVYRDNGQWHVALSATQRRAVASIREGSGRLLAFSEVSLSQAGSGYTRQPPGAYPRLELQRPVYVVRRAEQSDGLGGMSAQTHAYAGLRAEQGTGRGLLGFAEIRSTDAETQITVLRRFSQDWPTTGLPVLAETSLPGGPVLKRTESTYGQTTGSMPGTVFPFVFQSVESARDLNGAALPTVTTRYEYAGSPQYGDPTRIEVLVDDGSGKLTTNEYWPAVTSDGRWILGRLKRATVSSTDTGAVAQLPPPPPASPSPAPSPPSQPPFQYPPAPTAPSGQSTSELSAVLLLLLD